MENYEADPQVQDNGFEPNTSDVSSSFQNLINFVTT